MESTKNKINCKIISLFKKWSEKYRSDFKKGEPYTCVYGNKSFLKDQIEFVHNYLDCMLLDGTTNHNLKRIKDFLALQKAVVDDDSKLELHFCGGSPIEVKCIIETPKDIDVADVFELTNFESVLVCKGKSKRWTKKSAERFAKELEADLAFDGFEEKFCYGIHNKTDLELFIYQPGASRKKKCVDPALFLMGKTKRNA